MLKMLAVMVAQTTPLLLGQKFAVAAAVERQRHLELVKMVERAITPVLVLAQVEAVVDQMAELLVTELPGDQLAAVLAAMARQAQAQVQAELQRFLQAQEQ